MAMNVSRAAGGPVASMNVTPMADIMIVLLIIFMVITPLIRETDGFKLPPASNSREQKESRQDVVVSVRHDTTTFIGTERVDNLGELLLAVQRSSRLERVNTSSFSKRTAACPTPRSRRSSTSLWAFNDCSRPSASTPDQLLRQLTGPAQHHLEALGKGQASLESQLELQLSIFGLLFTPDLQDGQLAS